MMLDSWVLRSLAAASALAGIASAAMTSGKWNVASLTPRHFKLACGAFLVASLLFGALDVWSAKRSKKDKPGHVPQTGQVGPAGPVATIGSPTIQIGGDNSGPIAVTQQIVEQLAIQAGDSPEVRAQKAQKRSDLLAVTVLAESARLRRRLGLVKAALGEDEFDAELAKVRERVAPALSAQQQSGYQQLIAQERVGSLRHALNSVRAGQFSEVALLGVGQDVLSDSSRVQRFFDQVGEVLRGTEGVLTELQRQARRAPRSAAEAVYRSDALAFELQHLENQTRLASLFSEHVVAGLEPSPAAAVWAVGGDEESESARPLGSAAEYEARLAVLVAEAERLVQQRGALLERGKGLRAEALAELADLDRRTEIQATDDWATVVGKARALRALGRPEAAAAAFARYGDMFGESDPGARNYAALAIRFTTQLQQLGLAGGVFVFEVVSGSAAKRAGLQVGDIITSYDGAATTGVEEITKALHDAQAGGVVRLEFLRAIQGGAFERHTCQVPVGPLGAGLMPI